MASIAELPKQGGYPAGSIVLAPGSYVQSTPVVITSPYLSITSHGPSSSVQIHCSPALGTAPCWSVTSSPFSVRKAGTIGGFKLNGPGPYVAGAVGISGKSSPTPMWTAEPQRFFL